MESILNTIKKQLAIAEDDTAFDSEVIIYINSVLDLLYNKGVGPDGGFLVIDDTQTWDDFVPNLKEKHLTQVQTYIYLKVKLLFDPPQSTVAVESIEKMASEYEWHIINNAEGGDGNG